MAATPADTVTLTRRELYDRVRATPMRTLAAGYGLSDVGLAKACKRHHIPRPGNGYWALKAVGRAPRRPLPACQDPALQVVRIARGTARGPGASDRLVGEPPGPEYDPDVRAVLDRARALPTVEVAATLRRPHPLVAATKARLEGAAPDRHGRVHPRWVEAEDGVLSFAVGPASVRRGLLYLDALIRTVERAGGAVAVVRPPRPHDPRETVVSFCGMKAATIFLRERYRQVPRAEAAKPSWDTARSTTCRPTGSCSSTATPPTATPTAGIRRRHDVSRTGSTTW